MDELGGFLWRYFVVGRGNRIRVHNKNTKNTGTMERQGVRGNSTSEHTQRLAIGYCAKTYACVLERDGDIAKKFAGGGHVVHTIDPCFHFGGSQTPPHRI